jgi:hypothetical protein
MLVRRMSLQRSMIRRVIRAGTRASVIELESVLNAIRDHGLDVVLAEMAPNAQNGDLVLAWLTTPDWEHSRRWLATHPELLTDPRTTSVLRTLAGRDEDSAAAANQHQAILTLCRRLDLPDAYDIVTDLDAGAEAAWDAITTADGDLLMSILNVAPHLQGRPHLTPALAACAILLQPHDDLSDCIALMEEAARQGSETQRLALAGRLRRLAARRSDLRADVDTLIAVGNRRYETRCAIRH